MEDRDGIKSFTIPKTYSSTKDVFINEKFDSRNVVELFKDIQSCALEVHFDFRQNQCQSCDFIRNQKLQKFYNERKIQMKKTQDLTERLAFHLVTSRDLALNIATDGLQCNQLSFPIDRYLGNPNEGVHLSRRPDVLLASTGAQGYSKFGLLVCKIILGKGYATIPSINNKEFSSQLHYDHHFCKIQSNKKEKKNTLDLLGNSLIFCYEHKDLQFVLQPSQILPIAILWYELKEKFPNIQECQMKKLSQNHGTWDDPCQYLIPISSLSTPKKKFISIETIPLSPLNISSTEKTIPIVTIPLNSTEKLVDPRLHTSTKQTKLICYLDSKTINHKRLHSSNKTTIYTLIPFHFHSESNCNNSLLPLYIPVTDCFSFGLKKSLIDSSYIDLEDNQNRFAFEQMQISEQLIEQKRKNQSKTIRNSLQKHNEYESSKLFIQNGRKFLKEYSNHSEQKQILTKEFIEFFVREYHHENRSHIKRILAELMGVLLEKYGYIDNHRVIDMDIDSLNDHDERFQSLLSEEIKDDQAIDQQSSRDEFVKLLTKEACLISNNENETTSTNTTAAAAARTVIMVSNKTQNSLIIETQNTQIEESNVKRIKIDSPSVSNDEIRIDDHHDFDERQSHSRSRSQSTSSQNSSIKEFPNKHSTFSRAYQQNFRSSRGRHQRYNYNHQSIANHPRFATHQSNTNQYRYYQDNYTTLNYPSLMDISPFMNFSNSKPSHTIERLQMFLDNNNSNRSWS